MPKRETSQSVKKTEAPAGGSTTFDKKKTDTPNVDGTTLDMSDFKMASEVFKHIVNDCSTSRLKSQDLCIISQSLVSHRSHRAGLILMKHCVKSVVASVVSTCVRDVLTGSCLACRLGDESQDGHTCLLLESDPEEMHPCVSTICQQISIKRLIHLVFYMVKPLCGLRIVKLTKIHILNCLKQFVAEVNTFQLIQKMHRATKPKIRTAAFELVSNHHYSYFSNPTSIYRNLNKMYFPC
ncbi:uncharacterized protein LOC127529443 isoform X1 [Erpetoichthys calabaricus]|uniref:uncharacterized protein LOC127529443 isoform X1 n=1 Tax=Erpetoichthys calabaricus TaxID=27687 RepID=UPI002234A04D|nr:uncharacterized protein LOC127529443 isoform X1 [Erpetoichthys calabaricus]